MNALEHVREWGASADERDELATIRERIDDHPAGEEQLELCEQAAVLLDRIAGRMEQSGLVRAMSTSTPGVLRHRAAVFRAGRNPYAEESR